MLDFGVDKYGLNAYIYDSTNNGTINYDRVLFSRDRRAAPTRSATLGKGEWADVKVKIVGGALDRQDRRDAGQGRGAHRATSRASACSTRRCRARSPRWPTWPGEPGFTGDFDEYLAQKFPTSTAADFAVLEAGVVSEETYVEQGLYWATGHHADARVRRRDVQAGPPARRHADHRRVPAPVPRPGHADAAERRRQPGLRRRRSRRRAGRPRRERARDTSARPTRKRTRR